jgi:hypothetical protein
VREADPTSSEFRFIGEEDLPDELLILVDLDRESSRPRAFDVNRPAVALGYSATGAAAIPEWIDIALTSSSFAPSPWVSVENIDNECDHIARILASHPVSSVIAAQLFRASPLVESSVALLAESLAYGILQDGPEHVAWRHFNHLSPQPPSRGRPDVMVDREDNVLSITFNRPERRNAYRAQTRDELVVALELASVDESIGEIHLRGMGPSFGSGGDLQEFGIVSDGVTGHLIRSARSAAHLLSQVGSRCVAHVHGPCFGAGVELAAACGKVVAKPDTTLTLPEIGMGLIPGAGGTWSVDAAGVELRG